MAAILSMGIAGMVGALLGSDHAQDHAGRWVLSLLPVSLEFSRCTHTQTIEPATRSRSLELPS
jgi:hypothetical protein